jgi:hypothetical protein
MACILATLVSACSGSGDMSKSTGADQDVTKLADNFAKLKSFRATISAGGGGSLQGTVEYEAPDKVHVTAGTGSTSQEILCIGDKFYARPQASTWQTVPSATASCRSNLGPADPDALAASLRVTADKPFAKGGEDSVGGKKCTIYTQTLPSGVEFGACVADGLPLRIINKNPQGSVTLTFSDFDKPLDIKAPI